MPRMIATSTIMILQGLVHYCWVWLEGGVSTLALCKLRLVISILRLIYHLFYPLGENPSLSLCQLHTFHTEATAPVDNSGPLRQPYPSPLIRWESIRVNAYIKIHNITVDGFSHKQLTVTHLQVCDQHCG